MEKCNDPSAWHDGQCCCNCANQIELFKHPWNTQFNGAISESTGIYACVVRLDCDGERKGIIFEKKHGYCELYWSADKLKEPKYTKERVKFLLGAQRHNCQIERNKRSVFHDGEWYVCCKDVMNAEEPEMDIKNNSIPENCEDTKPAEKNVRMISQIEIWVLSMNPMQERTEAADLVAISYSKQALIDWMEAEKAPEPYYDDGFSQFGGGGKQYYKVFKKDSKLEWYNPLDDVNIPNRYNQGIHQEWAEADTVRRAVESGVMEVIPKES